MRAGSRLRVDGAWSPATSERRYTGLVRDTVLLDVDGTLLDTREFIFGAYEHALRVSGVPQPGREWLAHQVGRLLEAVYAELAPGRVAELVELHRGFQVANLALASPFEGAVEVLRGLRARGFALAAVTSRSRRTSVATLEIHAMDTLFDAIISAEDASAVKPDPTPLRVALARLERQPASAVMVGDSIHDAGAAHALGIPFIAATYGFPGEAVLEAGAAAAIADIRQLPAALLLV